MTAPGAIEVTTIDDPVPGPGEVIIEIAAVGLCGTDLHILAGEHGVLPVVPGHEVTGTVVEAGVDVAECASVIGSPSIHRCLVAPVGSAAADARTCASRSARSV